MENQNCYKKSIDECLRNFDTSFQGLSESVAKERLPECQKFAIGQAKNQSFLSKFFAQIKELMVLVLLVSGIISIVIGAIENTKGEIIDGAIILGIVVMNALFGVFQERKSEKAIESLKKLTQPESFVLRDGKVIKIKTADLVLGDIVCLDAGSIVPADLRLIESSNIKINESSLTGESVAVEKIADIVYEKDMQIAERKNMVYGGSVVENGHAKGIVVAIGCQSEMGQIAESLKETKKELTPLQKNIQGVGKVLTYLILLVASVTFILEAIANPNQILQAFLTAVAISVAAIPESMPAVITIIMSLGIAKLSKQKAIVKRMHAVETLGACDVICSDKTGTITQNKMNVEDWFCFFSDKSENFEIFLNSMVLCNDATIGNAGYVGGSTEIALLDFASKHGLQKKQADEKYPRINEISFNSQRKMMTTLNSVNDQKVCFMKGALDRVLGCCDFYMKDGQVFPLDETTKKIILRRNKSMCENALRVISFAFKKNQNDEIIESGFVFLGLCGLQDPPRAEIFDAVKKCKKAGMRPIMITGDYKDTAFAIAKKVGIAKDVSQVLSGEEIDGLADEEFSKVIEKKCVFARVSPSHKARIVEALKKNGHIVAMTGDGVNDVLALKEADCSIAMINGSDAARNVSQIVLMDSNFDSMPKVVLEGRRTINNIQRSASLFLTKTIYTSLMVIFLLFFHFMYPFRPIELTLMNFVTIGAPALVLALEPNNDRVKGGFLVNVVANALPTALAVFISLVAIIIAGNTYHFTPDEMSTMAVLVTTIIMLIYQAKLCIPFNAIRTAMYTVMCLMFSIAIVFFRDFFMMTLLSVKALMAFIIILTVGILLWFFFNKILNKNKEKLEKFL